MRISVCIRHVESCDIRSSACALPFGDSEIKRLLSIKDTDSAARSLCALEALSTLLSDEHIDKIPSIIRDRDKKPRFSPETTFDFNLSHSGELAAAALCSGGNVGIDLEFLRDETDHARIARRFFGKDEIAELEHKGNTAEGFYRLWTRKEASAKLYGTGLSCTLGKDVCAPFYKTFVIKSERAVAYMTVCAERAPDEIKLIYPTKEYKRYELQN